ncbi:MAG: dicarboxylate/amino acid:cation symporter [Bacteroidales bacterium]|nr:dicarboxylate/amino acid:cation symporter [Bacteroidales bacterium]
MNSSKFTVKKDLQGLSEAIIGIEKMLEENKTVSRKRMMASLLAEECIVKLSQAAAEGSDINITIRHFLRNNYINIVSKGSEIDLAKVLSGADTSDIGDEYGIETADAVRNMVLRSYARDISYRHFSDVNVISIKVQRGENMGLMDVLIAIVLAVISGIVLRLCLPEGMGMKLSDNLFAPVYTAFLNAIKMVMAPLVFFSIANSLGDFSNLRDMGRSGLKVFMYYTITTVFAIIIGWGYSHFFKGGVSLEDLNIAVSEDFNNVAEINVSIVDTLVNLVPSNIIGTFANSDMMQVIVLAIIIGIAMGKIGKYSQKMQELIGMFDALFGRITAIIISFLPFAVYASFTSLIITMNTKTAGAVSSWIGVTLLCVFSMLCVYLLMLFFIGRINPLQFLRKYYYTAVTAMSTCSSNATMPVAMKCCKNMGISPAIYKFSIPLGSTINMDGTSIYLVVSTLFLAVLSGITIPVEAYFSLGITILLLSMAAPAVPGAAIACLSTLLAVVGVPNESIAVLIGVIPLLDPILTASNVMGDGAVTTLVAKSENAMDMDVFNGSGETAL